MADQVFGMLADAPDADPYVGPDQQASETIPASFEPEPVPV
jgi:hypothetical protein